MCYFGPFLNILDVFVMTAFNVVGTNGGNEGAGLAAVRVDGGIPKAGG